VRRDVFIENDSGGFSVLAAAAADAIIEDERADDERFVDGFQAMLLMLYGDDSLPVRVVVDEPLTPDEEAQWLGRVSWRLDLPDGRLLVMGGFDPDVLSWWRDADDPDADGRGVGVVQAEPGSWRVDVYAHVGSMNGRETLHENDEPIGAFFRRCHPDRPVPLWLAHTLQFSGEGEPVGALDTDVASVVGFLVHLTPFEGDLPSRPEGGWFEYDEGRRIPEVFPVGIPATVADGRERPSEPLPAATSIVEIIESWTGDPLRKVEGAGVELVPIEADELYWIAGLASDSPPAFELWVSDAPGWEPPTPEPEFGVAEKSGGIWALGAPPNSGGWALWWGARKAAKALGEVPDGATLDLAMTPRTWEDDELDPAVGRALYSGTVEAGRWRISEMSPVLDTETLEEALGFVRTLRAGALRVREEERAAFDEAWAMYGDMIGEMQWDGHVVTLADPDERFLLMLAEPVFRTRFGDRIACDPIAT
jgi:hypothetical protein